MTTAATPRLAVLTSWSDDPAAQRRIRRTMQALNEAFGLAVITGADTAGRLHDLDLDLVEATDDPVAALGRLDVEAPFAGIVVLGTMDRHCGEIRRTAKVPMVATLGGFADSNDAHAGRLATLAAHTDAVLCHDLDAIDDAVALHPAVADRLWMVGSDTEPAFAAAVVQRVRDQIEERPGLLILTPSADLYGSDRALLHALPAIVDAFPTVIASAVDGPFVRAARAEGAAVTVLDDFAARRKYLRPVALPGLALRSSRTLQDCRRLAQRHHVGLVYVNTVAVPTLPLLRAATGRPVVVHVHERALGGKTEARLIEAAARRGVTALIANSHFTAESVTPTDDQTVHVVYNGIEPADITPKRPAHRVVCPARLHPKKGQMGLIEATALLRDRGVDIDVTFVGDALPEHEYLATELQDRVDALDLGDRVEFAGHRSDIETIYADHGIVAVPSIVPEEFSLVAAEGQMRGLAAIVSGPGGASEVIAEGETGLVVPPTDVEALAAAIEELAGDPDRTAALGDAGHQRMLDHFTVSRYRDDLVGVLQAHLPDTSDDRRLEGSR